MNTVPPVKICFPEEDRREILTKIEQCLTTGQLTLGKHGREFEERFAAYIGTQYAIAVSSGTSAIEIPLRILGVDGKEVIVPTNTFFATPAAVLHAGGRIRFVDIDPTTFSMDVDSLKRNITDETAGVIVVHIAGIVTPRMPEIQAVCKERNLFLLEDAAHAHGSALNGQQAGTFGVSASFSFYPTKVMTSGEGGMIATNALKIRDEAIMYRDQGKSGFDANVHDKLGYNWRMSEIHAILGLSQLARLQEFIASRTRIATIYDDGLKSIQRITPVVLPGNVKSNYYKYVALLDDDVDRERLKARLRQEYGIGLSGEVYELPCHLQPIFKGKYAVGDFPTAEDICKRHICLPVFASMTKEEAHYVLASLGAVLRTI